MIVLCSSRANKLATISMNEKISIRADITKILLFFSSVLSWLPLGVVYTLKTVDDEVFSSTTFVFS